MIDISLVIPYYNESSTISKTLNLIDNQSFKPKEVIFINSSSTDNSSEIIDLWIDSQLDRNTINYFNIISNSNTPSSSKNIGIKKSNFDWIAFMDCGLFFSQNWLEDQVIQLKKNGFKTNIVSGVCRLNGYSSFDMCAVAHTYGVGTNRVCIPGSLVNKEVFDSTGLFLENMRASYDRAWQMKTKKKNIDRVTPLKSNVSYIGINFSESTNSLIKKVILYSRPAVRIEGYYVPFIYILFSILLISLSFYSLVYSLLALFCYTIIRGYFLPFYKSNDKISLIRNFKSILLLPFVGLLIDVSRLCGYILGFLNELNDRNKN
jgi:glycosyltransferase involved in cell wall biosynthesis|tara:strand:- start:495 stop:1451 length:957 start_codon:yes stop_codon:yes gene_type:complete